MIMEAINESGQIEVKSGLLDMLSKKSTTVSAKGAVVSYGQIKKDVGLKELVYKALIWQNAEGDLVQRVLNMDDGNYLFDEGSVIPFTHPGAGQYTAENVLSAYPHDMTWFSPVVSETYPGGGKVIVTLNDTGTINVYVEDSSGAGADDELTVPILLEFRVRQRGASFDAVMPPIIDGDGTLIGLIANGVTLNDYSLNNTSLGDAFTVEVNSTPVAVTGVSSTAGQILLLELETAAEYGDVVTVAFDASEDIESLDLGLMNAFSETAVANHIPEPEPEEE